MNQETVLIVAGSAEQYRYYCRDNAEQLKEKRTFYITEKTQMLGYRPTQILFVGRWYTLKDIAAIRACATHVKKSQNVDVIYSE